MKKIVGFSLMIVFLLTCVSFSANYVPSDPNNITESSSVSITYSVLEEKNETTSIVNLKGEYRRNVRVMNRIMSQYSALLSANQAIIVKIEKIISDMEIIDPNVNLPFDPNNI